MASESVLSSKLRHRYEEPRLAN